MTLLRLIPVLIVLLGCAAKLEEMKVDADLSTAAHDTYVYGAVFLDRRTVLTGLEFENLDRNQWYVFRASSSTAAGPDPDLTLFSVRIPPGKWRLIKMAFVYNGLPTVPARVDRGTFEAVEGKGNFIGRYGAMDERHGSYVDWPFGMALVKVRYSDDKAGVDSLMALKFAGFDAGNTVAAAMK